MDPLDMFKPYSPEIRGDLEKYLKEYDGTYADNPFHGPKYFFVIKEKGWLIPNISLIRVDRGFVADIGYFVNSDFLLESMGPGKTNMSLMGAEKGVYDPSKALKCKNWSISGLNFN